LSLAGMGTAMIMVNNLSNSLVQSHVTDAVRGRVMSIYSLTFFGFMPLGGMFTGLVAEYYGEPLALQIGGVVLLIFAGAVWLFMPQLRRLE
ncbi:MAG: MFS transporter, partial [Chloroflexota bacterium]